MQQAFEGFLRYLKVERNASELTRKSYAEDFNSFVDFCEARVGHVPVPHDVTVGMLRSYLGYLDECQYAKTTIARRLACLRSLLRFCRREELIKSNPGQALRTPRTGRKLPHFLTTEEVGTLLESPPANIKDGLRDRAMLETMYSAGLRVAELVGLDIEDWDQDADVLKVRGKGKKERIAPIGSYASKALKNWLAVRFPKTPKEQGLFLNRFGTRLTTRSVGRMLEKYIKQSGLNHKTSSPHVTT